MDSMIGYKNERYLYFGRFAAKLDDIVNYIPARASACLMILAAFLTGLDYRNAWRIFKRDRYNHASPNSAQTESVCAGALNIQLAGDAYYFGRLYPKKTIGDPIRPVEYGDIRRCEPPALRNGILDIPFMPRRNVGCGMDFVKDDDMLQSKLKQTEKIILSRAGKLIHGGDIYSAKETLDKLPDPPEILDFSANINPLGLPGGVRQALRDSVEAFDVYPDPLCRDLVRVLSNREGVPAEWILCGNGAADLIYRTAQGLKPKKAMVLAPTFARV